MKTDIHPKFFDSVEIKCSCGNVILTASTRERLKTELCSKCHPFYTGQQKLVDTAGRVDKFEAKRKKAAALVEEASKKAAAKKSKKAEVYKEKEVPQEVIERAMGGTGEVATGGKWGQPIGDAPATEVAKSDAAEVATEVAEEKASKPKKVSKRKAAAKKVA
ncbi:50S ribosomal protein L31 [Candidatus Peregrinibacteria bacterium]|nr:50S ribosomal protein L31 [Candidatus Peregrinibacteria bacterium]